VAHIEEDERAALKVYIGGGKLAVASPAPARCTIPQGAEVSALYSTDEIATISAVSGAMG
jgi:hypothetical protein